MIDDEWDEPVVASFAGQFRKNIAAGFEVQIVLKSDQGSGRLTQGIVQDILTSSSYHPHGIKVRLKTGQVGRVRHVLADDF